MAAAPIFAGSTAVVEAGPTGARVQLNSQLLATPPYSITQGVSATLSYYSNGEAAAFYRHKCHLTACLDWFAAKSNLSTDLTPLTRETILRLPLPPQRRSAKQLAGQGKYVDFKPYAQWNRSSDVNWLQHLGAKQRLFPYGRVARSSLPATALTRGCGDRYEADFPL